MRASIIFSALLVCVLMSGCGGGGAMLPGGVPACGKVTYKGVPVADASIIFSPQSSNSAGKATTNSSGAFVAWTINAGDGVLPGEYQVSVHKTSGGVINMSSAERERLELTDPDKIPKPTPIKHEVPEKYSNPATSGLTVTIPAGGKKDILFELTD